MAQNILGKFSLFILLQISAWGVSAPTTFEVETKKVRDIAALLPPSPLPAQVAKAIEQILQGLPDEDLVQLENGHDTSVYLEADQVIERVLGKLSPVAKEPVVESLFGKQGSITQQAAKDVDRAETELADYLKKKEAASDTEQPWESWRHLCLRYVFTQKGWDYCEKILSDALVIQENKMLERRFLSFRLGLLLLDLPTASLRFTQKGLTDLAVLAANFGSERGIKLVQAFLLKRDSKLDVNSDSLKEIARERLKAVPGLVSVLRQTEFGIAHRWLGGSESGGARTGPVVLKDGSFLVGWDQMQTQENEAFRGIVWANPETMQIESFQDSDQHQVYGVDGENVWIRHRYQKGVADALSLFTADFSTRSLVDKKVTTVFGETELNGAPLFLNEKEMVVGMFASKGAVWVKDGKITRKWTSHTVANRDSLVQNFMTTTPGFDPRSRRILLGTQMGYVYLLDENAQLLGQIRLGEGLGIGQLAFLSDGTPIVASDEGSLVWLRAEGNALVKKHEFPAGCFASFAVLSDDQVVVSACGRDPKNPKENEYFVAWVKDGKLIHKNVLYRPGKPLALKDDRVVVGTGHGYVVWMKDGKNLEVAAAGEPRTYNGKAYLAGMAGHAFPAVDGGVLIGSEGQGGSIHWLTPWKDFEKTVLAPTEKLGVALPKGYQN